MHQIASEVLSSISASVWAQRGAESPFFQDWFGSSKATKDGKPELFYMNRDLLSENAEADSGLGYVVTPDRSLVDDYGNNVSAFFVKVENPYPLRVDEYALLENPKAFRQQLQAQGHDGILFPNDSLVVFDPRQMVQAPDTPNLQTDLFQGDFADKHTRIERVVVVSSKGDTAIEALGNVDSAGIPIAPTVQALENFWNAFEGTQAADEEGRPLRLYHSTNGDITHFELNRKSTNNFGILGDVETTRAGIFLTEDVGFSEEYLREGDGQNVMPLYLNTQNPLDLRNGITEQLERSLEEAGINVRYVHNAQTYWELFDNDDEGQNDFVDALKKAGYDGAIFSEDRPSGEGRPGVTFVAFSPEQIKSALGNRGTFDPENADIRYRQGAPGRLRALDVIERVEEISQQWLNAPPIHTVQSVNDLPFKAISDAAGAFYNGRVYLVADNLANLDHAEFVLLHETIGHYGLKGVLGHKLDSTMLSIYQDNPHLRDKADTWLALNNSTNMGLATEEVLSDYVNERGEPSGWSRLIGTVRKGVRALGFKLSMNDLDVGMLISDSRRWVKQKQNGVPVSTLDSLTTRFRRSISNNFTRWFGKSKVVDELGNPRVVYHGSSADIEVFNTNGGTGKTLGTGAFFSSIPATAGTYTGGLNNGNISPVYLSLSNPAVFDAMGANWSRLGKKTRVSLPAVEVSDQADEDLLAELLDRPAAVGATKTLKARNTSLGRLFPDEFLFDDHFSTDDLAAWARKQGYEGVIIENVVDQGPTGSLANEASKLPSTIYVCFRPEQIKSAIGNNGEFDPNNPDIRYSTAQSLSAIMSGSAYPSNFLKWFGASKVINPEGRPLKMYHGTNTEFTRFDSSLLGSRDAGFYGKGFYFTPDPEIAEEYADTAVEDAGGEARVIETYLSLQNPFIWSFEGEGAESTRKALAEMGIRRESTRGDSNALGNADERRAFNKVIRAQGYDGVIVCDDEGIREVVAFSPEQIKSANENTGSFSMEHPDIRYSRSIIWREVLHP